MGKELLVLNRTFMSGRTPLPWKPLLTVERQVAARTEILPLSAFIMTQGVSGGWFLGGWIGLEIIGMVEVRVYLAGL
jgi:hypothetical protein